jgi:SAM-dependent methyltransferase
MRRAPVESTGFRSSFFAAATCMSVVEHGVDLTRFFSECARILRPEGLLVISTDYWPEPIDLGGLTRFAFADRIFDRAGALHLCETASAHGLHIIGNMELEVGDPVIESEGFYFTFVTLVFERA